MPLKRIQERVVVQFVELLVPPIMEETMATTPVDVLVVMQQQSPMTQKVQRTVETLQLQFSDEIEYQLLSAADTGEVQLLSENGETKDDTSLPTLVKIGEPTEEDQEKIDAAVQDALDGLDKNSSDRERRIRCGSAGML